MGDMLTAHGQLETAAQFYWQSQPQDGFYCLVHRRQPGDLLYNPSHEGQYLNIRDAPDCPDYQGTARRHAALLSGAGVDHIIMDATNLPQYDAFADAIQLRPFEVRSKLMQIWRC